jgi:hypothetical protein
MQRTCSKHPYEPSENLCRSCGREYCPDCLVYPNGPKKLPLCLACAVAEAGVRSTARPQRKLPKREIRRRAQRRIEDVTRAVEPIPIVFEQPLAGALPFSDESLPEWFALLEGLPLSSTEVEAEAEAAFEAQVEGGVEPAVEVETAVPADVDATEPEWMFPILRPLTPLPRGEHEPAPDAEPNPPLPMRSRSNGRRLADAVRTTQDFSADPFAADAFDASPFGPPANDAATDADVPAEPPRTGGRLRPA